MNARFLTSICWSLGIALGVSAQSRPLQGDPDRLLPWTGAGSAYLSELLDVDGDGRLDLLMAPTSTEPVALWRGTATGRFDDASSLLPSRPSRMRAVTGLDADHDGNQDLVVGTDSSILLWLGDGVGGLRAAPGGLPGSPSRAQALCAGDFDADGNTDLLLGAGRDEYLWLGDGAGGFVEASFLLPSFPSGGVVAALAVDVEGDGDLDLCVAHPSRDADVYYNDGRGLFFPSLGRTPSGVRGATSVSALDADGDGRLDLLFVGRLTQPVLWSGRPGGLFVDASAALPGTPALAWAEARDLDGDGDRDVLAAGDGLAVLRNDGSAGLALVATELSDLPSIAYARSGDLDGDGDADVVLGRVFEPARLLWNDGGGALVDVTSPRRAVPGNTRSLAHGDFDGDGEVDVLAFGPGGATLWRGDGDGGGQQSSAGLPTLPDRHIAAATADLNGDGNLDVLVGIDGAADQLWSGDGRGGFTLSQSTPIDAAGSRHLELGDVDGDGDLDAVFFTGAFAQVARLWLGDGQGGFTDASSSLPTPSGSAEQGVLADFDGDGDLDVALVVSRSASLWLGDGTGAFVEAPAGHLPSGLRAVQMAAGDFDLDGDVDLFAAGSGQRGEVWENDGAARFTVRGTVAGLWPFFGNALSTADLDDDGDLDLLVSTINAAYWFRNDGLGSAHFTGDPQALGADIQSDHSVSLPLDLDRDGDVDLYQATDVPGSTSTPRPDRILLGLRRQLLAVGPPRAGKPWELRLLDAPTAPFLLNTSLARTALPISGLGVLRLDPATLLPLASGSLDAEGRFVGTFTVPADPGLIGRAVHFQALSGQPLRLGNAVTAVVTGL